MKHYEDDLKVEEKIDMVIRPLRWGLVPSYTKAESIREACKTGNLMINARFLFYFGCGFIFDSTFLNFRKAEVITCAGYMHGC